MSERAYSTANGYRFGYQGSEGDNLDENKIIYTTEFRQLDVRLGRWMSIDPRSNASWSPYNSMNNNPILYNDIFGDVVDYGSTKMERFKNKVSVFFAKTFGKGHQEFAKQFKKWETAIDGDGNNIVYKLERRPNNEILRDIRDGSPSVKKDASQMNLFNVYYSPVGKEDEHPDDENDPCAPLCVPEQKKQLSADTKQKIFPHSESEVYTVSPGSTLTFTSYGRPDRLRIYSGGHKIYDTGFQKYKKSAPHTVDLDLLTREGLIECKTIKVKVSSGWDRPTIWNVKPNIPGDCK
jgi:RHS repeat-associated protein